MADFFFEVLTSFSAGSRRSSAARGASLAAADYRNARSLSLGYQAAQAAAGGAMAQPRQASPSPMRAARTFQRQQRQQQQARQRAQSTVVAPPPPPPLSPSSGRPVLRRESAQDYGDDVDVDNPRARLNIPHRHLMQVAAKHQQQQQQQQLSVQPPDLRIELLTESSNSPTPSSASPYSRHPSLSPFGPGAAAEVQAAARRHSHCQRPPPIARNKSAPVTPLSRSATNVSRMPRSPSKDGFLSVPDRQRGSSLPEGREQKQESDLYR